MKELVLKLHLAQYDAHTLGLSVETESGMCVGEVRVSGETKVYMLFEQWARLHEESIKNALHRIEDV